MVMVTLLVFGCSHRSLPESSHVPSSSKEVPFSLDVVCHSTDNRVSLLTGGDGYISINGVYGDAPIEDGVTTDATAGGVVYLLDDSDSVLTQTPWTPPVPIHLPHSQWDGIAGPFVSPSGSKILVQTDPHRGLRLFILYDEGIVSDLGLIDGRLFARSAAWRDDESVVILDGDWGVVQISLADGGTSVRRIYQASVRYGNPFLAVDQHSTFIIDAPTEQGYVLYRVGVEGQVSINASIAGALSGRRISSVKVLGGMPAILLNDGKIVLVGQHENIVLEPRIPSGTRPISFCALLEDGNIHAVELLMEGDRTMIYSFNVSLTKDQLRRLR